MPDTIVLKTPRFQGEWELDYDDESLRAIEWRWVKKISGYTLGTAGEGLAQSDPDLIIAFACIALVRAGRISRDDVYVVADELAEIPFDGAVIRYIGQPASEEEEPANPPEPATPLPTEPPPENTGASSSSTSEPLQARLLSPTGAPD